MHKRPLHLKQTLHNDDATTTTLSPDDNLFHLWNRLFQLIYKLSTRESFVTLVMKLSSLDRHVSLSCDQQNLSIFDQFLDSSLLVTLANIDYNRNRKL